MSKFNHLHCHSSIGSMQDSMASIDDLFKRAQELGQSAIAITDHGTMAGVFDARKASKKYGVKYIPGCEMYFVNDVSDLKQKRRHLVLLAKNESGYRNLLQLNYEGFINSQYVPILGKVFPRIDWDILSKYHKDLICLTACSSGPIASKLLEYGEDGELNRDEAYIEALKISCRLKDIFGEDLYLELQPHSLQKNQRNRKTGELEKTPSGNPIITVDQPYVNKCLINISKELNIPVVATCDVHYISKEDAKVHDMLMAINSKKPLSDKLRHRYGIEEFYVKSADEVIGFFNANFNNNLALQLANSTIEISNMCEDSTYLDTDEVRFPIFDPKEEPDFDEFLDWLDNQGFKNSIPMDHSYMRFKCINNFKKIYGHLDPKEKKIYKKRIVDEIKVFEARNFSSYMLITSDFISKAKKEGIPIGPGRGCLHGDANVLTENGFVPLKDINIDDFVYTCAGDKKRVLNTYKYKVDEKLLKIKTKWSFGDIILTPDHELYGEKSKLTDIFKRHFSNPNLNCSTKVKKYEDLNNNPKWDRAENFNASDCLFMPFPKRDGIKDIPDIDLANFIPDSNRYEVLTDCIKQFIPLDNDISIRNISIKTGISRSVVKNVKCGGSIKDTKSVDKISAFLEKHGTTISAWKENKNVKVKLINRKIPVDENFLYFLGRWVGDGWFRDDRSHCIGIAFHSEDYIGINKIDSYLSSLGFESASRKVKDKNLLQLFVYGEILERLVKHLVPDYKKSSSTKHLPEFFRNLNNNLLESLLRGLMDSDGHIDGNRSFFDTTSLRLVNETKELLLYLKIPSSVKVREPYYRGKYKCAKSYKLSFNRGNKKRVFNNGYFVKILDISETSDEKYVYDIEVEGDHSYVTQNYVVHNSVAGSLVANLLNIHEVNPMEYGLLFERFLNKEKTSFPDIDTDICPDGRAWVKNYIINKYGENRVAHVSNLSCITPKVVLKDIARSLELGGDKSSAFKIANEITDTISEKAKTFEDAYKESEKLRNLCEKYPDIEKYGRKLIGLEKTYSTHAGGLIISDTDLSTYVPLRYDKNKVVSIQYEKNRCESSGLIKMDLLGLEHLEIIDNTVKNIQSLGLKCLQPHELSYDDPKIWDMVSEGKTMCVFQMSSPHMRSLCKRIRPRSIEDLSIINALGRPSASKSREIYMKRRDGKEKISFKYKCLREPLKNTLGICVYEEQQAKLAQHVAGWNLNKADGLRKLTKLKGKDPKLAEQLEKDFVRDASAHSNLKPAEAQDIWTTIIEPFSEYGFNKSHGISYSLNGYQSAYYKYYYPAPFMAATLRSEIGKASSPQGKERLRAYKKEAKRMGIKIVAPDINSSNEYFSVLDEKTIAMGLATVKGVGIKAINNIIEVRNEHKFTSFTDFLYRTNSRLVRKDVIQALAKAGCLDSLGITRRYAYTYYAKARTKANKYVEKNGESLGMHVWDLLKNFEFAADDQDEEWEIKEILKAEGETLSEYISGTINDLYAGFFINKGMLSFNKLTRMADRTPVRVEAIINSVTQTKTKSGKNKGSAYASCEIMDTNKDVAVMKIWSNEWAKMKNKIKPGRPFRAICSVNIWNDTHTLVFKRLEALMEEK